MSLSDDEVRFSVEDDGRGFEAAAAAANGPGTGQHARARVRAIVVDASALLQFLLQTPLGTRLEARLFRNQDDFRCAREGGRSPGTHRTDCTTSAVRRAHFVEVVARGSYDASEQARPYLRVARMRS